MPWRNYVDDVELKICEQKADCRQRVNVAKNGGLYYTYVMRTWKSKNRYNSKNIRQLPQ